MADSDFSEASPRIYQNFIVRGGFFRRFFAAKKAAKLYFL